MLGPCFNIFAWIVKILENNGPQWGFFSPHPLDWCCPCKVLALEHLAISEHCEWAMKDHLTDSYLLSKAQWKGCRDSRKSITGSWPRLQGPKGQRGRGASLFPGPRHKVPWGIRVEKKLSSCINFGIFNRPQKNSKPTQVIQGFLRR